MAYHYKGIPLLAMNKPNENDKDHSALQHKMFMCYNLNKYTFN